MGIVISIYAIFGAVGFGAISLRLLRVEKSLRHLEFLCISFVVGFGIIGWVMFVLGVFGYISKEVVILLLAFGCLGLIFFKGGRLPGIPRLGLITGCLWILSIIILLLDITEALSPPADADTLAYHFTIPKTFMNIGKIEFLSQAFVGAIPLLVHMTYLAVLTAGGELALTFWVMYSNWFAALLLFVISRNYLSINWSIITVLIYLTIPGIVFGGGSGQVEPRLALFVLLAGWACTRAVRTGNLSYVILAGMAVGFYLGSKYFGAFMIISCGVILVLDRQWLTNSVVYSVSALFFGFQWYLWNFLYTGDPVFPIFFEEFGIKTLGWWEAELGRLSAQKFLATEKGVPSNLLWFFLYPIVATFDSIPIFEGKYVGFGPIFAALFPFTIVGLWYYRERFFSSSMLVYGIICLSFYICWFFFGPSQRIRHLLPILPLLILCCMVPAVKWAEDLRRSNALVWGCLAVLIFQLGVAILFSQKHIMYVFGGTTKELYLENQVKYFPATKVINRLLGDRDKILIGERQLLYYLDKDYFYSSPHVQTVINMWPVRKPPSEIYQQLKSAGITHLMIRRINRNSGHTYEEPIKSLTNPNCLVVSETLSLPSFSSRTLHHYQVGRELPVKLEKIDIVQLRDSSCLK